MICCSDTGASVATVMTCVWPRVNTPLPCGRGRTPTSHQIGRTSVNLRPSGRTPSAMMWRRMTSFCSEYSASPTSPSRPSNCSLKCSETSALTCSSRAWRSERSNVSNIHSTLGSANSRTAAFTSSPGRTSGNSFFGTPSSATMPLMNWTIFLISSCAKSMPLSMTSSDTSFAPASTIRTASAVPATVSASSEASRCSSVGLTMYSPSMKPTLTPLIGPAHGISLIASAAEEPIIAGMSGELFVSTDMTVATTDTSCRMPFGNSGRSGRSMSREVRMAFSAGRPSRRFQLPGMWPTAYSFSSKSTLSGKKSMPGRGVSETVQFVSTHVSP